MSSIGTGYDLAAAIFSPDGRIFQVEYAEKAVDGGCTVIAMCGKDGVVTAVDKSISSKLHVGKANSRIDTVGTHIGFAMAGLYPDARALLSYTADEASDHLAEYRQRIPLPKLVDQIAEYVHIFTLGISRPFGCMVFLSAWDKLSDTSQLYLVEPSGMAYQYRAWSVGKNRQAAKTEIEKLKLADMGKEDLIREAARIVITVRDETKDKNVKIEMGWVGKDTDGQHMVLPDDVVKKAEEWAKQKIEQDEDMD